MKIRTNTNTDTPFSAPKIRSTFSTLFYLNRSKKKKDSTCPVMCRISIDSISVTLSCKIAVTCQVWDSQKGRIRGKTKDVIENNIILDKLQQEINLRYDQLLEANGYVTAEEIKNGIQGIGCKKNALLALFEAHNREYKKRVGVDRTEETYESYQNTYRHLNNFIKAQYRTDDIPFSLVDARFIQSFDFYLRIDKQLKPATVLNHMILLKKMTKQARREKTLKKDPFISYIPEKPQRMYRHLTAEEFNRLLTTPIEKRNLARTRDWFVFCSFTGLAYSDLKNLKDENLFRDKNKHLWIKINRQKTGTGSTVKLLDIPKAILDKYKGERKDNRLFNVISLTSICRHLKKIAELCHIERNLTFHMSRHNFATRVTLNEGVPIETVSRMMGHTSIKTTQIYAHITNKKVAEDMKAITVQISNKYQMPKEDMPQNYTRNQHYNDKLPIVKTQNNQQKQIRK